VSYIPVKGFISYWRRLGVVAVEVETAILYLLTSLKDYRALSFLLASNSLVIETVYSTISELRERVIRVAKLYSKP